MIDINPSGILVRYNVKMEKKDVYKRQHDASTFNRSIGYQDIEIVKGRNIETKIVYLVKRNPTNIHLQFDGIWGIVRFLKRLTIT